MSYRSAADSNETDHSGFVEIGTYDAVVPKWTYRVGGSEYDFAADGPIDLHSDGAQSFDVGITGTAEREIDVEIKMQPSSSYENIFFWGDSNPVNQFLGVFVSKSDGPGPGCVWIEFPRDLLSDGTQAKTTPTTTSSWAEIAASGFFEYPASEGEFGSTRVDDDAWHSVSTRYTADRKIEVWVDGVLQFRTKPWTWTPRHTVTRTTVCASADTSWVKTPRPPPRPCSAERCAT